MVTEAMPRSGPDREIHVMAVPENTNLEVSLAVLLARYAPPSAEPSVNPTHPSNWTVGSLSSMVVGAAVKVAVIDFAASMVTTHVPVPEHPAPDHPPKLDPGSGFAVRVTWVPEAKDAEQVAPQVMPAGEELTVPDPVPDLVTLM